MSVILRVGWVQCVAMVLRIGGLYCLVVVVSVFGAVQGREERGCSMG